MPEPLAELLKLSVRFRDPHRPEGVVRAVDNVSLTIAPGEILGLVGESGSGKTTLGKTLLRLHEPSSGRILLRGKDITHLGEAALRPHRRAMQMVFQDPLSSFNPRHSIGAAIATPLLLHRVCPRTRSGCRPASVRATRTSSRGGQLQRAAIGRALAMAPALIVADEVVSKLDVSVRAQILNLLRAVQAQNGLAMLFITHDLHVARFLCHRIGVMHLGKLLEIGPTERIFSDPAHDYTRALIGTLHGIGTPEHERSPA